MMVIKILVSSEEECYWFLRKMEVKEVPGTYPTTTHGRFENALPVWGDNFHCSFKFDVEVATLCSHFWREFGIYDSCC